LAAWQEVWAILLTITRHKCADRRDYFKAARRNVDREVSLETLRRRPGQTWEAVDPRPTPELVAIATDTIVAGPAARFASRRARAVAEAGGRVYRYRVDHPGAGSVLGATHTADVPLLFGTWNDGGPGERLGGPQDKAADHGQLNKQEWGLIHVAQMVNCKGPIWATWDEKAPSFFDYLGDMRVFLDAALDARDGSEGGSEVIGGVQKWRLPSNWKFATENFIGDGYHAISHRSEILTGTGPGGPGAERHAIVDQRSRARRGSNRRRSRCTRITSQSTMIARLGKKWYSNSIRGEWNHGSHCTKYATTSSA